MFCVAFFVWKGSEKEYRWHWRESEKENLPSQQSKAYKIEQQQELLLVTQDALENTVVLSAQILSKLRDRKASIAFYQRESLELVGQ